MKNYSEQDSSDTEEARIINYNTGKHKMLNTNGKHNGKWQFIFRLNKYPFILKELQNRKL